MMVFGVGSNCALNFLLTTVSPFIGSIRQQRAFEPHQESLHDLWMYKQLVVLCLHLQPSFLPPCSRPGFALSSGTTRRTTQSMYQCGPPRQRVFLLLATFLMLMDTIFNRSGPRFTCRTQALPTSRIVLSPFQSTCQLRPINQIPSRFFLHHQPLLLLSHRHRPTLHSST